MGVGTERRQSSHWGYSDRQRGAGARRTVRDCSRRAARVTGEAAARAVVRVAGPAEGALPAFRAGLSFLALALLVPPSAAAQAPRAMKIALADGVPAARISAAAPFVLRAGELVIETAEALVSPETGAGQPVLALGSFATEARAREAAEAFREQRADGPAVRVRRDPETGRHLAILPSGPPAGSEAEALRAAGFAEAGVFRIPGPVGDDLVVRPVGGSPIRFPGGVSLIAEPPGGGFVEWEGNPYRGSLTVFRSGDGVTVINHVDLEEYLFGVIPRELPPELFPEIEALKAQALAARTYALTPRYAYLRRGYDLCSGPACQVYGGVAAEHPVSTAAVRETAGEALFHDGRLIDALYTAACGGHTENAENVFSNPTPYLVARACIREAGGVRLGGAFGVVPFDAALVRLAGAPARWNGAELAAPASGREAAEVFAAAAGHLGLPACEPGSAGGDALTLGEFGRLVEAIRCRGPESTGLGPGPDGSELARGGEPAVGRLLAEGLLDPSERGLDPGRPVSRREVIGAAASLLRRDGGLFRRGQIREVTAGDGWVRMNVEADGVVPVGEEPRLIRLQSDGRAALFREIRPTRTPGRDDPQPLAIPTGELRLRVGDFVRFHAAAAPSREEDPVSFELLILEDLGDALDRSSRQSSWFVPKNNTDLSNAVNEVKPIGRIVALEPLEIGASGRIVRLRIVGTDGTLELRGLRIRRLLGLAENLFRAEPRRDASGGVTEWWFSGRGWGHGLGLCQAGAYGMAASGAGYREILAHYYPGTEIRSVP